MLHTRYLHIIRLGQIATTKLLKKHILDGFDLIISLQTLLST